MSAACRRTSSGGSEHAVSAIVACYKDGQAIPLMHQRLTEDLRNAQGRLRDYLRQRRQPDDSEEVIRASRRPTRTCSAFPIRAIRVPDGLPQRHGDRDEERSVSCSTATCRIRLS